MVSKTPKQPHPAAKRIAYVRRVCQCENKTQFAKWIGAESPQAVRNWELRGLTTEGALQIKRATGASTDWLLDETGEPFPNGPTLYAGAKPSKATMDELLLDVAALRMTLGIMVGVFVGKRPSEAAAFAAAIRDSSGPELAGQRTTVEFLKMLDKVAEKVDSPRSNKPAR